MTLTTTADGGAMTWAEWARSATDPANATSKPEALADLVVLDLSRANIGGLVASSILGEFGAEVIRIESPEGDPARHFTPNGLMHRGVGLGYLVEARNKHHITLRLESPEGQAILRRLVRHADVVIETFPPGTMDRWGIGYAELKQVNPRLVYTALSTFGQFGPRAAAPMPDYDITDQALSGLTYFNGEPANPDDPQPQAYQVPTKAGAWLAWYVGGAWAAFGTAAALLHRGISGEGQLVDVTPSEGLARFLDYNLAWYHASGHVRERIGSLDLIVFPYTFVRCQNGSAFLAAFSDASFARLARIMGRPELASDPRFETLARRIENAAALVTEMEEWTAQYTAQQILDHVQADAGTAPVVTGRVNSPADTFKEENWWVRGALQRVQDPIYGEVVVQGPVWKMSETPPRLKWLCRPVGYDNEHVYLRYLGLGRSNLSKLKARGVI